MNSINNSYIPFEHAMLGNFYGLHPTDVKGVSNANNYYQCRYLWNKIYSKFKFTFEDSNGEPLKWDLNTFRFLVFRNGSVGLFNSEMGKIYAPWTVEKLNIYLNPKKIKGIKLLTSEFFGTLSGEVGKDCSIVKIQDDYRGVADLVESTAELLANCDKAINVALMNANVNLVAFAENKKEAEEIKNAYAQATNGTPLVIIGKDKLKFMSEMKKDSILEPFTNHDTISSLDKLLVCRRTIVNNFLTEIGIKNANTMKKERLISDEVNQNNEEISANINIWYENIKEGFETFNKIYGTNLQVELVETDTDNDTIVAKTKEGGENV